MENVGKRVKVTQIRGTAGRPQRTKDTIAALGLGRPGRSREITLNPALIGMVKAVRHLIKVELC